MVKKKKKICVFRQRYLWLIEQTYLKNEATSSSALYILSYPMASAETVGVYIGVLSVLLFISGSLVIYEHICGGCEIMKNTDDEKEEEKNKLLRKKELRWFLRSILWSSFFIYSSFLVIWSFGGNVTNIICEIFYTIAFVAILTLFWCIFGFWLYRLHFTFLNTNLAMSLKWFKICRNIIAITYVFVFIGLFAFVLPGISAKLEENGDDKYCASDIPNVGSILVVTILILSIVGWNITFCSLYIYKYKKSIKYGIVPASQENVELKVKSVDTEANGDTEKTENGASAGASSTDENGGSVGNVFTLNIDFEYEIKKQALITVIMVVSSLVSWILIIAVPLFLIELIGFVDWIINPLCILLILPQNDQIYSLFCQKCHKRCCKQ